MKPETVIGWHRKGFKLYWTWKSRTRGGRPRIDVEIRTLIRRMARENPTWGAPRIHGELLKLGFEVSEATVSRYMPVRVGQGRAFARALQDGQLLSQGEVFERELALRLQARSDGREQGVQEVTHQGGEPDPEDENVNDCALHEVLRRDTVAEVLGEVLSSFVERDG
ncbi:MAG: helix-turn-helix domain-containing protein [Polyangiales bacterium]